LFSTVGTLNQGYPLLRYKDIAPIRRLLVARRTAPNSTRWAGQRAPRGEERHHASVRPDPTEGYRAPINIQVRSPRVGPNLGRVPDREGPWGMQGSGADTYTCLAPRAGEGPLRVAHDISHRVEPDVRPCSPCIY
jgi:hypothetical protein